MKHPAQSLLVAALLPALVACGESSPPAAETAVDATQAAAADTGPASAPMPPAASRSDNAVMRDVFERFKALRSFHATMRIEGGPQGPISSEMDFVAPDRYRLTMQAQGMEITQTQIGKDMYASMGGQSMKMPAPADDPARWHDEYERNIDTMQVEALGSETLDGESMRKYRIRQTQPDPSEAMVWIDGKDLVRQARIDMTVEGNPTTTTLRYSRFDDPSIRIDAP